MTRSSRSLKWVRLPSDGLLFQCLESAKEIGTLRWEKGRVRDGIVQLPSGKFLFRRTGFWSQHLVIIAAGSNREEAKLLARWRDRLLAIPDGPSYVMRHTGTRRPKVIEEWWFSDDRNARIMQFHEARLRRKEFEISVEIQEAPVDAHHLDLMLIAGLFWVLFDLVMRAGIPGMDASLASIAMSHR